MSKQYEDPYEVQYPLRRNPNGKYEHRCPVCGEKFRSNNKRAVYCCIKHRKQSHNKRYYEKHKEEVIKRVLDSRKVE